MTFLLFSNYLRGLGQFPGATGCNAGLWSALAALTKLENRSAAYAACAAMFVALRFDASVFPPIMFAPPGENMDFSQCFRMGILLQLLSLGNTE